MQLKWLGHASFLLELQGIKIITDPFDEKVGYPLCTDKVDIATVSHGHWDHNAVHLLKGEPEVINSTGYFQVQGIEFRGFQSYHDKNQGKDRGINIIYKISAEDVDILHLGDLGHILEDKDIESIGNVDILLLPVGGTFTIDAGEAFTLAKKINPGIIIPMHFNTPHLSFDLAPVEAFTEMFDQVIKKPDLKISKEDIKQKGQVIVLDYIS